MSTPMVKAILNDTKTMTRRIIKPQPIREDIVSIGKLVTKWYAWDKYGLLIDGLKWICPFQVGQILWVKETYMIKNPLTFEPMYKVDNETNQWGQLYKWKPSIFMPKKYARIWLEIISIKVEKLQDISHDDIISEGWNLSYDDILNKGWNTQDILKPITYSQVARQWYQELWGKINGGKKGFAWSDNPWVWRIEFKRIGK